MSEKAEGRRQEAGGRRQEVRERSMYFRTLIFDIT